MTKTEAKDRSLVNLLLLLASVLVAILLLAWPAQAQADLPGISTTQTADPNPAVVGRPHAFTIEVTNNSVPQNVGLKDFLPEGMKLESATPSQGTCAMDHHGANAVECALGELPSGGSAKVDIGVTPTLPGTATNNAVGEAEFAPADADQATVRVNPTPEEQQQGTAGEARGSH